MANGNPPAGKSAAGPDRQAVIVAMIGLAIILLIVLIAALELPGPVPQGQTNSTGQNIVSVATAAIAAVGAVVGAYLGVKTANSAREDTAQRLDTARTESVAAAKRNEIMVSTIAGSLPIDQARTALQEADARIKDAKASGLL